ncbi:MAG: aldo/keto reductase [Oscillospiraceae bacterium]
MNYRKLGNTQIEVSEICFGSLTLGPVQANLSISRGADILAYAIEQGINFTDTAQLYETYPYIKQAMKQTGKYDLVISSKTYAYSRELAIEAVEQARKELNRDYIDIFMLHEQESIHTLNGHGAALEYLFECKQKGIIKAVGASMHHVSAVYGAIKKELDVIHPMLNFNGLGIVDGSREDMEIAIKQAHDFGIGIFSMKALGGGNLFKNAEQCLSYITSLDYIDCVAIGMQREEEVDANIGFFKNHKFDKNTLAILDKKERKLHIEDWCTGCGNCIKRCNQSALRIEENKAVCDFEKCVLCGYCSTVCSEWCIKIV